MSADKLRYLLNENRQIQIPDFLKKSGIVLLSNGLGLLYILLDICLRIFYLVYLISK
jgi:hypothetical protein